MKKILVLHGPNLNLLGKRESAIYGEHTLADINKQLSKKAAESNFSLEVKQSNDEAELIKMIQGVLQKPVDYLIINPAAFTHTSIALRDALLAVSIPFIEVHLSNIYARESFRHKSYFSDIAKGVISGFGPQGYLMALDYIIHELNQNR